MKNCNARLRRGRFWPAPGASARPAARAAFWAGLVVAGLLLASSMAQAQIFSEPPPPVPPAVVPGAQEPGPAMNLAPASGPQAEPEGALAPGARVPGASVLNPNAVMPAIVPVKPTGQGVLALSARFANSEMPVPKGVRWRIYADKPDATGALRLVREEKAIAPEIVLPPGGYIVHCALGLASQARRVTVYQDTTREVFSLNAGGLRIEGRVGTSPIPAAQISFDVYKGSQFETSERAPLAKNVQAGAVIVLPEGIYYIISNYGDGNSAVRSDIRVKAGKLTDVTVQHRAAVITLKLVADQGGEALANTSWSVITPGGDVIKEMTGAFPSLVLAEGEYRAIARNEGRSYEHPFNVVTGVDGEVEVNIKTSMKLPSR